MRNSGDGHIKAARQAVRDASRITVLTGAGVSAESGVPTFRGGGGAAVWRGMPFETLSSARMVEENLPLVWEWFDYRRGVLADCRPNAGHYAIAEAERSGRFDQFTLITQNIDGLHAAAGSSSVIELHGNIHTARCLSCGGLSSLSDLNDHERPPVCPQCGDSMRPHVVLFGEMLDIDAIRQAVDAAESCDVCIVAGTSALVSPANMFPDTAKRHGAKLIEINPEETPLTSSADISIAAASGAILPRIFG